MAAFHETQPNQPQKPNMLILKQIIKYVMAMFPMKNTRKTKKFPFLHRFT